MASVSYYVMDGAQGQRRTRAVPFDSPLPTHAAVPPPVRHLWYGLAATL